MRLRKGEIPGPRILTAIEPLMGQGEKTGTPEEIRAFVRKQKAAGADLIKIYASGGMTRGAMTMSQEQLNAACDEAKKQGLRTLVHAYQRRCSRGNNCRVHRSRAWPRRIRRGFEIDG